jgi:hypothetical protein
MGLLLKIALVAVAAYAIWALARRWFGLLGGGPPAKPPAQPQQPPPSAPPEPKRVRVVEDAQPCPACGAYVASAASKCGRSDCPQVGGRPA